MNTDSAWAETRLFQELGTPPAGWDSVRGCAGDWRRAPLSPGFAGTGGAGPGQEMLTGSTPGLAPTLGKPWLRPPRSQPPTSGNPASSSSCDGGTQPNLGAGKGTHHLGQQVHTGHYGEETVGKWGDGS